METLTPAEVARYFTPEDFQRGRDWLVSQNIFSLVSLLIDLALLVAFSIGRPGRWLWAKLAPLVRSSTPLDRVLGPEWRAGAVFLAAVVLLRNLVALPLNFYSGLVLARRVGLSHDTAGHWLGRYFVGVLLVLASAAIVGGVVQTIRDRWPKRWWLILGVAAGLLVAADAAVEPLQMRLHYTVRPLAAGALRTRLEALLAAQHARVGALVVLDASRDTTDANAFVTGFGPTKELVLTDTLLAFGDDAVVGAVAHEVGHHRDERLPGRLVLAGLAMVAFLWLTDRTLRWVAARGARHAAQGMPLVRLLVIGILLVTSPVRMAFNRAEEGEADALELSVRRDYDAYIAEQVRLARANAMDPVPPAWLHLLMSHPSPAERIERALEYQRRAVAGQ